MREVIRARQFWILTLPVSQAKASRSESDDVGPYDKIRESYYYSSLLMRSPLLNWINRKAGDLEALSCYPSSPWPDNLPFDLFSGFEFRRLADHETERSVDL